MIPHVTVRCSVGHHTSANLVLFFYVTVICGRNLPTPTFGGKVLSGWDLPILLTALGVRNRKAGVLHKSLTEFL
jgi:hypothetical protein